MSPLPVLEFPKPAEEEGPPYYEWVEVGVLDYCPDTKRYLVKRAVVPNSLMLENGDGKYNGSSSDTVNGEDSSPKDISINGGIVFTEANGYCGDASGAVYTIVYRIL